jgi:hypothetical protein
MEARKLERDEEYFGFEEPYFKSLIAFGNTG